MIKGNYGQSYQQSLNELFASELHRQQGFKKYTPYSLVKELLGFAPIFDSGNSMFYNMSYENISKVKFDDIRTRSFIEKECRLLQYVRDRSLVDIDKAQMDFSIYKKDIVERRIRIPELQKLYQKKMELLRAFQKGKDIWKNAAYL